MTERNTEIEIAELKARKDEKEKAIRMLYHINIEMYGFVNRLLSLLQDGKIDEAIKILEASRDVAANRLINR